LRKRGGKKSIPLLNNENPGGIRNRTEIDELGVIYWKQLMKEYTIGVLLTVVMVFLVIGGGYLFSGKNIPGDGIALTSDDIIPSDVENKQRDKDRNGNDNSAEKKTGCFQGRLIAEQIWEMPQELLEISGIAWMGHENVGVIQDNDGIIFIFSLSTEKVEQQIRFGPAGDYEGLAYANGNFFVMRSDGHMLEVHPQGKVLNQYDLPLSATDNIESFFFDAVGNQLLIGQKDGEKGAGSKNFYSFDLASRKLNSQAIYTIDLNHPVIACGSVDANKIRKGKKSKNKGNKNGIRPSEMAIHPKSKDIFIADGPNQRILVLSPEGDPKYYLAVDKRIFPQVEGLMFSPMGDFYVSTEGIKEKAKIGKMNIVLD